MSKYFIFLSIVAIVISIATIFVFYTHTTTNNPIKHDYYLEITQDSYSREEVIQILHNSLDVHTIKHKGLRRIFVKQLNDWIEENL